MRTRVAVCLASFSLACLSGFGLLVAADRGGSTVGIAGLFACVETALFAGLIGLRLPREFKVLGAGLIPAVALGFLWIVALREGLA